MQPIVGAEYPTALVPLFDAAKRNIDICVYDWRWYPDQPGHSVQVFNAALVRAVKRGVQVRAVLNSAQLVPILTKVGISARTLKDHRVLHVKMVLIDGQKLVIGSHNFTRNAFGTNLEVSVALDIPSDVTRFAEFFDNLYNL